MIFIYMIFICGKIFVPYTTAWHTGYSLSYMIVEYGYTVYRTWLFSTGLLCHKERDTVYRIWLFSTGIQYIVYDCLVRVCCVHKERYTVYRIWLFSTGWLCTLGYWLRYSTYYIFFYIFFFGFVVYMRMLGAVFNILYLIQHQQIISYSTYCMIFNILYLIQHLQIISYSTCYVVFNTSYMISNILYDIRHVMWYPTYHMYGRRLCIYVYI